jgi:hypothetical protein
LNEARPNRGRFSGVGIAGAGTYHLLWLVLAM